MAKSFHPNFLIKPIERKNRKTLRIEIRRIRISQIHMAINMIKSGDWKPNALQELYDIKIKKI
ncbi:MAG: hypothetical protein ACW972_08485 [Promethearchaeota archaeon]|jgi:hypothetical protein